ncbi:hypothetical protein [Methylomonas sp. AM2-LC]|uniref:hypothetical protein n=1 Tax=Methylomonas sp. AM2-LC TaxID=3153301 RepID=UPI003263C713
MNKIIYRNTICAALLSFATVAASASDDVSVTESEVNQSAEIKDQNAENVVLRQHIAYRRGLAQQERSTAANYLANGKSILQNKHLAIAAHQDAMADAYEKAVVVK